MSIVRVVSVNDIVSDHCVVLTECNHSNHVAVPTSPAAAGLNLVSLVMHCH